MPKRHIIMPTLVATALAAAGCGSSSKAPSQTSPSTQAATTQTQAPSGTALTTAELIAKADPICARLDAIRVSNKIRTRQDYVRISAELASSEKQALAEMVKLTPPASLANAWSQMLAGYRTSASNVAQISRDAAAGTSASVHSLLVSTGTVQQRTAAIAKQAGFNDCGKGI